MTEVVEAGHWASYNARQAGRPVRDLLMRAMAVAGPGRGRTAIDLGCGAGLETRALLAAGWRVLAIDGEPDTSLRVMRTLGGRHPRLTVRVRKFRDIVSLPSAELVYSGYALPHQSSASFARLWPLVRAARPRVLAVNLFGDRDGWAANPDMTFLSEREVRGHLSGMELAYWQEEDAVGPAFSGPKHWHVFDVIATAPSLSGEARPC